MEYDYTIGFDTGAWLTNLQTLGPVRKMIVHLIESCLWWSSRQIDRMLVLDMVFGQVNGFRQSPLTADPSQ
jgi:hypothetical protein